MQKIISKSIADIFSPMILSFIFKVGFGSILLWIVLLWVSWDLYSTMIASYIAKIPFVGGWEWLQSSGTVVVALIVGYMLIIITISIATSIFSEPILKALSKKHYPHIDIVGSPNIATSIYLSLKAGVLFLLLFLFTFPLIFVPIVGQVWMLWLWSILIKEPNSYDVGSLFVSDRATLEKDSKNSTVIAMIASLFNYVPIVNMFAPLFGQILFLHKILDRVRDS
ncbi:Probable transmembrane protein [hydrothermal vent metagenome]|uniref:Probable transmembrane protein n=1 Tax=hydrothermal vent metagenome TaxID=652676 RepID=A0A1W1CF56_9ZZZZ